MPIDNVQLKREDVVGSEVVLEDINPKTSTNSVRSTATGDSLDVVLDRIWNAINARLSRVVNSVNGRTGVVVLDASDIGLGKVDNVSFGDIKTWVINMMRSEFKDKNMKLVNDLTELNALISTNNKSYAGSPFFSTAGYAGDKRSYIGYIYYDEGTKKLEYKSLPINTVGFTDNSLIYNENVNGVDTRGGGLAVNIHKDEDALYLKNPDAVDKSESGLMIDKSKVVPRIFHCNGIYYDENVEPNGLIFYMGTSNNDSKQIAVFIDDECILTEDNQPYAMNLKADLRHGDVVLCSFANEYNTGDSGGWYPELVHPSLRLRQPCIGYIENAHWDLTDYVLRLYSIKPYTKRGLAYEGNSTGDCGGLKVNIKPDGGLMFTTDGELDTRLDNNGFLKVTSGSSGTDIYGLAVDIGIGLRADPYDRYGNQDPVVGVSGKHLAVAIADRYTGYESIYGNQQDQYKKVYGGLRYVRNVNLGETHIAIRVNNSKDWSDESVTGMNTIDIVTGTKGLCIDEENVLGVQLEPARNDLQIDPSGKLIISDTYMPSLHPLELISNGCGPVYFKGQQPLTVQVNSGLKMTENMKDLDYSIGIKIAEGSKLKIDENGCLDIDLNIAEGSCLKIDDNGCLDIDYAKLAEKLKEYNTDSETSGSGSDSTETPDNTGSGEDDGTTTDPDNPNPDSGTTTPETPDDTGGDNTGDDSGNTGDDTNTDSGTDTGDTGGSSDYVPEEGEYGDPNNPDTGEGTETTTPEETTDSGET